jgi:hypothetical protein
VAKLKRIISLNLGKNRVKVKYVTWGLKEQRVASTRSFFVYRISYKQKKKRKTLL